MPKFNFFPQRPDTKPIIYAYSDTRYPGCLKIGDTTRPIEVRMKEHYPTITPGVSYKVELIESAMYDDGNFQHFGIQRLKKNKKGYQVTSEQFAPKSQTDSLTAVFNRNFGQIPVNFNGGSIIKRK